MSYALKVVDRAGAVLATLNDVVSAEPLRDRLNRAGSLRFGLHNLDPAAPEVRAVEREIQVWRNGSFLAGGGWVVPVAPEARVDGATDVVEFECRGLFWYFDRRFVGKADRTNELANGSFEDLTLSPWTAVGTTATRDTTRRIDGAAAKLVQATAGTDTYIEQTTTIAATGVGTLLTLAGWFYVSSAGYLGEAFSGRGFYLERSVGGVVQAFDFVPYAGDDAGNVPLDSWQRREVTIHMPPNVIEDITARAMSVGGEMWVDELSLTAMESVSYYDTDQSLIANGLVSHLQDPGFGKSDLAIGRSTPATGIKRDRHYQHAEHANGGRALADFTTLDDGFDHSIETTSSVRTYTTHFPRKGTSRPALSTAEIVSLRWVPLEGEQAASSITVLGDGDGPDREEGSAIDAGAFGGVTLEEVLPATTGTPIDGLDAKAAEELRVRSSPAVLEVTLGPGLRIGALAPGDTVSVPVIHGFVDTTGIWRVLETAIDLRTDCLTFVANPEGVMLEALIDEPGGVMYSTLAGGAEQLTSELSGAGDPAWPL